MVHRMAGALVWMALAAAVAGWACPLFAADEAQDAALSKALAQAQLFAGLTDAERDALKAAATLRRGAAKERIIQQGQLSGRMSIILGGEAEIWVNQKHVVTLSAPLLVGEVEFLDGQPGSADVILTRETDLIVLDNAALNGVMEKNPRIGYVLLREIGRIEAQRLRSMNPK